MKLSENTNVAMPIKNMVGIIIAVAMGIFAYTEITAVDSLHLRQVVN